MILAFILTAFLAGTDTEASLLELRKMYYAASVDKEAAKRFLTVVNEQKSQAVTVQAYRAMAYMLQAKYAFNPYAKMSNFKTGREILEKAVQRAPSNAELRFLRFSIQTNAPFFLNYSSNISSDKQAILRGWKEINDADLKSRIKNYMLASSECNEHEKSVFR
ncbi:MAG: hypothetical protein K0S09_993 [Sphingobacteriaceae bacterium]|jgi:hypothetical protein|nr:hypothetical protein [Sphingobacteriaceae bacterium]